MEEKKTIDMFVRDVPLDVWESVDRLCRRRGLKRRDFVEQALTLFEAGEDGDGKDPEVEKARMARERVDQIMETMKGYEGALKLKKSIEKIRKNRNEMGDRQTQMNLIIELKKMNEDLDEIIGEFIPKHEIPEDLKARRKMGLPDEYCQKEKYAITRDFDRKLDQMPEKKGDEADVIFTDDSVIENMKRKLEELRRKTGKNKEEQEPDQKVDTTGLENGVDEEPVKKENDSEVKMRYVGSNENARSSEEKKKEIRTTFFGRGFEGLDGE
jgi:hypothetical protein